jgi:hypothetical protein
MIEQIYLYVEDLTFDEYIHRATLRTVLEALEDLEQEVEWIGRDI